jgi:putative polyhydroxyalkanoate system protein
MACYKTGMSRISIHRSHKLPQAQAVAAADAIAARLKAEYGMQSRWDGDTLHFERSGANGTLRLAPHDVRLDVRLGFLLSPFRDSIAAEIERQLEEQLVAKRARPTRRKA